MSEKQNKIKGCLHVVATPIGNLGDLSPRALQVLAQCDVVAAEDTRHTRRLLQAYQVDRALQPLHEHNEDAQAGRLLSLLKKGQSVALVSDAGTPLLSDPGFRLVSLAAQAGIEVVSVPGPSAITAALSVCGLPTDRFSFEGFLPSRATARRKTLEALRSESRTQVFFESGKRIVESLQAMAGIMGEDRPVAVCRELTKQFETVLRGPLNEVAMAVQQDAMQQKGEFVIVLGGSSQNVDAALQEAGQLAFQLSSHVSPSQAARIAAAIHGVSRRDVYRLLESGD